MRSFLSDILIVASLSLSGTTAWAEEVWTSRPDLCGAGFPIQELEGVTFLRAGLVSDHFIDCRWSPDLDLTADAPARQPRKARCANGTDEWRVDAVFIRTADGQLSLRSVDKRLPRKTYGPCPEAPDAKSHDRGTSIKPMKETADD